MAGGGGRKATSSNDGGGSSSTTVNNMDGFTTNGGGKRVDVTMKLSQLQNLCKRDPDLYKNEYLAQVRRLESEFAVLALQPNNAALVGIDDNTKNKNKNKTSKNPTLSAQDGGGNGGGSLIELIQFAAAVSSSSYKGAESDRIANMLMSLLVGGSATSLHESSAYYSSNNQTKKNKKNGGNGGIGGGGAEEVGGDIRNVLFLPTKAMELNKHIRKTCVSALILMRNKGVINPLHLWIVLFRIMSIIADKSLRELLYRHLVNDVINMNTKGKRNDVANRSIQIFIHRIITTTTAHQQQNQQHANQSSNNGDNNNNNNNNTSQNNNEEASSTFIAMKRSIDVICELYRRRVWTDERTIAIVASAIQYTTYTSVLVKGLQFFLNIESKMHYDKEKNDEQNWQDSTRIDYHSHSKKTSSRHRHTVRQLKNRKRQQHKREGIIDEDTWIDQSNPENEAGKSTDQAKHLYPAIELLRDPQGLVEHCMKRLRSNSLGMATGTTCKNKYETKLLLINFITRLIGNHELLLLPIYSFLQKYLNGQQKHVTAVLAYCVQSCHIHVPPNEICALLKTISHEFITERCTEEQMAVGINTVRAIITRVPTVLNMDDNIGDEPIIDSTTKSTSIDMEAFCQDIASYSNHRDRSVSMAGKSFLHMIRELNPALLKGKDRGLVGTGLYRAKQKPMKYGEQNIAMGIEGSDLYAMYEAKKQLKKKNKKKLQQQNNNDENDDDDGWEEVGDDEEQEIDSDDDDGWEEVPQEDDDDDKNNVKKNKNKKKKKADNTANDSGEDEEQEQEDDENEEDSSDDEAPELIKLDKQQASTTEVDDQDDNDDEDNVIPDVTKMSIEERNALKQKVSSTRIYSTAEFIKMKKLVEREKKAMRDPRVAARRKRAIARGEDDPTTQLSDDDDDSDDSDDDIDSDDDDAGIHIQGAVQPDDLIAEAKRKRQNKLQRMQKILQGREQFDVGKQRTNSGSTNIEKQRHKNFQMAKYSMNARTKGRGKGSLQKRKMASMMKHEARKRRRKL